MAVTPEETLTTLRGQAEARRARERAREAEVRDGIVKLVGARLGGHRDGARV